jgi:hypothetical protein
MAALQRLLGASHAQATGHLRDIIDDRRSVSAPDITTLLTGMKVLALATATARGEPRISAVDGHFLRRVAHYGGSPLDWGEDIRLYRLAASWMVGYASDREKLLGAAARRPS